MKKISFIIIIAIAMFFTQNIAAQVTIGSHLAPDNHALLDLKENLNGTSTKGMFLPRVALTGANLPAPLDSHKAGMIVYNTATVAGSNGVTPGVYINNGGGWIMLDENAPIWLQRGSTNPAKTNAQNIYQTGNVTVGTMHSPENAVFHVDGTKDNAEVITAPQAANDFVITQSGSVGIGTISPNANAILDISSTSKGILGPRVTLRSHTDNVTIALTAADAGMLVYNTGTNAGLTYKGYVVWTGTEWRTLTGGSLSSGTISTLVVNGASLSPAIYEAGVPYTGTLNVSYTGSNGGVYGEMTITGMQTDNISLPSGLTAHLSSGNFSPGAGTLAFTVTGTPAITTPHTTTFHISIGGRSGDVVVGAGDGIAPGDLVYYVTPEFSATANGSGTNNAGNDSGGWLHTYAIDNRNECTLPILGGKLRLDGYFVESSYAGAGRVSFNPRLVNITNDNVKLWFSAMTTQDAYNSSNVVLRPQSWLNLDDGIWFNYGGHNSTITSPSSSGTTGGVTYVSGTNRTTTEVVTVDLSLDDKWYRIYYFPVLDNKNGTTSGAARRRIYISIQRLY